MKQFILVGINILVVVKAIVTTNQQNKLYRSKINNLQRTDPALKFSCKVMNQKDYM